MAQKIVYNHKAIEKKWRENWEKNPVNVQFDENGNKKQKYCPDSDQRIFLVFERAGIEAGPAS